MHLRFFAKGGGLLVKAFGKSLFLEIFNLSTMIYVEKVALG